MDKSEKSPNAAALGFPKLCVPPRWISTETWSLGNSTQRCARIFESKIQRAVALDFNTKISDSKRRRARISESKIQRAAALDFNTRIQNQRSGVRGFQNPKFSVPLRWILINKIVFEQSACAAALGFPKLSMPPCWISTNTWSLGNSTFSLVYLFLISLGI